jgi:hypothetical protein
MRARCVRTLLTTSSADSTTELTDLDLAATDLGEEDELTIRRDFAPRSPAKVAVDVSDADATWKWSSTKADAAGRRVGLDIPALDGEAALAWNRDDVEKTQEVFALKKSDSEVIALLTPKRRPLPRRPVESTAQLMAMIAPPKKSSRFIAPVAICLAAMFIAMFVTRLSRTSQAIIGEARAAMVAKPVLGAMAVPQATTGTLLTTLEGKGQRVFVDGKVAFEGGQSFVVDCGKHIVRVGNGKSHEVDVPCGAELALTP